MNVAVFGATGFVGSYIIDALVAAGHQPSVLLRPGSEDKLQHAARCRIVPGEIADTAAVAEVLAGSDAAIYLIGILRENPAQGITFNALQYEGARQAIDVAVQNNVDRFLLMSANGVGSRDTSYLRSKQRAEQHLLASNLRGTVFRPSVIFGDPRGRTEIATQLSRQMIDPPLPAPAFFRGVQPSRGSFSLSPVFVEDVAQAFVAALSADMPGIYSLGGAETLRWPAFVRRLAEARGRRKLVLPVPAFFVQTACRLFDRFSWFPLTRDQFSMLLDGNVVESRAAFENLGINEQGMTVGQLSYLKP